MLAHVLYDCGALVYRTHKSSCKINYLCTLIGRGPVVVIPDCVSQLGEDVHLINPFLRQVIR